MKIYIASSWKNELAVTLLTERLRGLGHEVVSWIENNYKEGFGVEKGMDFEEWVWGKKADNCFVFDINGATESNLVIYVGPSGTDAWAEVGVAYQAGVPVFGLWAKGEPAGLMRRMVTWCENSDDLFGRICRLAVALNPEFKTELELGSRPELGEEPEANPKPETLALSGVTRAVLRNCGPVILLNGPIGDNNWVVVGVTREPLVVKGHDLTPIPGEEPS